MQVLGLMQGSRSTAAARQETQPVLPARMAAVAAALAESVPAVVSALLRLQQWHNGASAAFSNSTGCSC